VNPKKPRNPLIPLIIMGLALGSLFFPWKIWLSGSNAGPQKKMTPVEVARRYFQSQRYDQLIRLAGSITPKSPDAPEIYGLAGQSFLARGEVGNAKKAFERSLEVKLEQPEAINYLAAIYLASGDSVRGLALLELSAKLRPDDNRPWLAMGKVRQDMGELELAAKAYEECLSRNPDELDAKQARTGRIRALVDSHKEADAQPLIDEALKLDPANAELLGLAAISAQSLGRSDEAEVLSDKSLAIDPEESNSLLTKAQLAFLNNKSGEAEETLKKAVSAKPNQPQVLQLLMQAQAQQGKAREAAETKRKFQSVTDRIVKMDKLTKEISQKPDDPKPRYEMGLLAVDVKMQVLAEQCFRAALDIDPKFELARQALEALGKPGTGQ
jgi:tetratricopeptide (TPR) repeat protein